MNMTETAATSQLPTAAELSPHNDSEAPTLPESELNHIEGQHGGSSSPKGTKFLVAINSGEESEVAWKWMVQKAQPGDHVFMTSVLPSTFYDPTLDWLGYGISTGQECLEALRKLRQRRIEELKAKSQELTSKGVETTVHILHGDARYSLVRAADYHKVDLIVVGRRHLTGFQRFTSGSSVSSYVVQHSTQSVIVVKA